MLMNLFLRRVRVAATPAAATKEPTEEPLRLKLLSRVINGLVSWGWGVCVGMEMRPESCVFYFFGREEGDF